MFNTQKTFVANVNVVTCEMKIDTPALKYSLQTSMIYLNCIKAFFVNKHGLFELY